MTGYEKGEHRWSGWPGAFCHYCGYEDANEVAIYILELDPPFPDRNGPCPASDKVRELVDRAMNPEWFAGTITYPPELLPESEDGEVIVAVYPDGYIQ